MALVDEKIPYEILIRFGDDGTPKGAHVQYRRRVILDGELLKDEPLAAESLGLVDFPSSQLMTQVTETALVQCAQLTDALRIAEQTIQDLSARLAQAESGVSTVQGQQP